MKVKFSRRFTKQYKKSPKKIQRAFARRLDMFMDDPYADLLHNHPLLGKYKAYRSINITGDWRALYREVRGGDIMFFDFLGTHSQLYK